MSHVNTRKIMVFNADLALCNYTFNFSIRCSSFRSLFYLFLQHLNSSDTKLMCAKHDLISSIVYTFAFTGSTSSFPSFTLGYSNISFPYATNITRSGAAKLITNTKEANIQTFVFSQITLQHYRRKT